LVLTVLLATVLLPTVRAPILAIAVATDRTDYVLGMPVSATATIAYSGSFPALDEPVRVEWHNATWVLERAEYVPKTRISSGVAEAIATWVPPNPGLYYVNMTSNTTNGSPPLVTGSAVFRVWNASDYVIALGIEVRTDRSTYDRLEVVTATADLTALPGWIVGNRTRLEGVQFGWYYPSGAPARLQNVPVTNGRAVDTWAPDVVGSSYNVTATYLGNDTVSNYTGFAVLSTTPPVSDVSLVLGLLAAVVLGAVLAATILVWRRRGRKEPAAPPKPPSPQASGPSLNPNAGRSYAILSDRSDAAFEIFARGVRAGVPGLCITRLRPEDARARYGLDGVPLYWLSRSFGPDTLNPTNLGAIVDLVRKSVKGPGFRVLLDGVEYLYTQNDFAKVAKFVQALADVVAERKAVLLIPLDPKSLDPDRLAVLTRDLQRWP
jgi:hypothetical protein